jgi:hypothetical protein
MSFLRFQMLLGLALKPSDELVPIAIQFNATQVQHRLSLPLHPTHPCAIQSLTD